jgi:hypothetical protein
MGRKPSTDDPAKRPSEEIDMSFSIKEALDVYENGKHRRYALMFSVNGGAFAVARIIGGPDKVLGGLSLRELSIGMTLFTAVMVWDIFEFGRRSRKPPIPEVFGRAGKAVLLLIGALICSGWLLVAFGAQSVVACAVSRAMSETQERTRTAPCSALHACPLPPRLQENFRSQVEVRSE